MSDPDVEADEAQFSWGYFLAIVGGTILLIAVICSIATLSKKAPAKFSMMSPVASSDARG